MQDCSSDSLLRNLLTEEIAEAGGRIAQVLQGHSALDRHRRREIRTLLREAFQSTQDESSIDRLVGIAERLRRLLLELGELPTKELEHLLERRQKFGVVDEGLVERGTELSDTIHRHTEQIALDIEERMKRGIQVSSGQQTAQGDRSLAPRPLSTGQELMELVVKKHW